jgi:membrane-anchored protein YejM (alkaline phosphatase superfamily)
MSGVPRIWLQILASALATPGQVGQLLKKLDDLGIADNTIVIYTTDDGAETFTWPDGGATPFREGGYRVPALVRWRSACSHSKNFRRGRGREDSRSSRVMDMLMKPKSSN